MCCRIGINIGDRRYETMRCAWRWGLDNAWTMCIIIELHLYRELWMQQRVHGRKVSRLVIRHCVLSYSIFRYRHYFTIHLHSTTFAMITITMRQEWVQLMPYSLNNRVCTVFGFEIWNNIMCSIKLHFEHRIILTDTVYFFYFSFGRKRLHVAI
jgi:hypothetical protein